MSNIFNSVQAKIPKRHKFKLNHQAKLTGEMGQLLPIFCEEVIPSDRIRLSTQQLIRFAPLSAPIMSDIDCYLHAYFVPNRLIWKDWETHITGSKNGKKLPDEEVPTRPKMVIPFTWINKTMKQVASNDKFSDGRRIASNGSLMDYLQFPTVKSNWQPSRLDDDYVIDELPLRAYQRIFFDWYRDENLSEFDDFELIDNDKFNNGRNELLDASSEGITRANLLMKLQMRAWKKDYFTSALPFAQKGDDVLIPGSGSVDFSNLKLSPITTDKSFRRDFTYNHDPTKPFTNQISVQGGGIQANMAATGSISNTNGEFTNSIRSGDNGYPFYLNTNNFIIEGSSGGQISEGTIRELRRAMAAQRFLEREAVGGTRYIEQILSFFGVKSSDARLQRAEYLGGSKQPVVVSQVLQTSQTTTSGSDTSPLGQPAGNAVSAGGKYLFDRTFEEHGFVIILMSVIPRAEYMNGYPRKYLKNDRFDYYWPQFAHIGEQEIQRQELNYNFFDDSNINEQTFGYTPRYAEYRFINSHVHGDFKDTLNYWTLVRDYGQDVPILNEEFITCKPSTRIFAYEDDENTPNFNHLWIQVGFNIDALRPLPKYGESI